MADTPGSPSSSIIMALKQKVVTAVDRLVTISEEPLKQALPSRGQLGRGRAKRSPSFRVRKKSTPHTAGMQ